MKTLLIGLIVLSGWTTLSTYLYVCNIKGLCNESKTIPYHAVETPKTAIADTLSTTMEPAEKPENLTVYFAFDKSDFMADESMDTYFHNTQTFLHQYKEASLNITGHTDEVGTENYNQELGYRRANSIKQYFEMRGVGLNRINITSYGEALPAGNNQTETGRSQNRRVEITIKN